MWSSHSFRMASWNAKADARIGTGGAAGRAFALAMPPLALRTVARAIAPSRHTAATAAILTARDVRVVVKVDPLSLFDERQQTHRREPRPAVADRRRLAR